MMEAVEYWDCGNTPDYRPLMVVIISFGFMDPLTDALMWTGEAEVVDVSFDGAPKMTLAQITR